MNKKGVDKQNLIKTTKNYCLVNRIPLDTRLKLNMTSRTRLTLVQLRSNVEGISHIKT